MSTNPNGSTFVLVPGMCHGAWCFDDLAASLREAGHRVLAVTLSGVAERAHLLHGGVNLDTHVTDVVAAIENDAPDGDLVLVGHSYGGMVITGAADRIARADDASGRRCRVDALVFLDAVVAHDGESCWDVVDEDERRWYVGLDDSGFGVPPLPFFDERATAHPLASVLQRLRVSGTLDRFRRLEYVYALDWPGESPLRRSYDRVRDDPRWNCHELNGKHNLMRDKPDDLLQILLDVARR
ncbi:alpha/beta fold hydrolase [Mycolicibacterium lacusdiani]|uniref:alpha/beta fold hydrolase n=1 Tax=Mycolicibacterium lacusdiani TaxID=2895283 RepID=UPI001F224B96|nr:alpha/beta fold hydrolase [Mycolicibacterium lacusdiani]